MTEPRVYLPGNNISIMEVYIPTKVPPISYLVRLGTPELDAPPPGFEPRSMPTICNELCQARLTVSAEPSIRHQVPRPCIRLDANIVPVHLVYSSYLLIRLPIQNCIYSPSGLPVTESKPAKRFNTNIRKVRAPRRPGNHSCHSSSDTIVFPRRIKQGRREDHSQPQPDSTQSTISCPAQ